MTRTTLILIISVFIGCGQPSAVKPTDATGFATQAHTLLPLARLLAAESNAAPKISPDGRYISWIAPHNGTANLFVAPVNEVADGRPVTRFSGAGIPATDVSGQITYRWHYDSEQIIFPMGYAGDENFDLHIVDINEGRIRNLTPLPDRTVEIVAYGRSNPDDALVSISTFGSNAPDIHRLNLSSGDLELMQANDGAITYIADNNLDIRLRGLYTAEGGIDFYRYGYKADERSLYRVLAEDLPALSASGNQKIARFAESNGILYLYDARDRNTAALIALNMETGKVEELASDLRVDLAGVLYHPRTNEPQAYAINWTDTRWRALSEDIKADLVFLNTVDDGEMTVLDRSDDDNVWVVRYMTSFKPVSYYVYHRDRKTTTYLFSGTPQLEGLVLSRMHPYVYTTDDGFDLVSYITLPPWTDPDEDGRPDQPVPMVVFIHGGPSDERAQIAFGPIVHWLANRGYGFQYVNFRGSAGFGKAYVNAQKMQWGGRMHQDVLDQVSWAVERGIADPDRIAILGGSYGGYEALVGMTMTPEVFACGVDIVGPSNLEIFMPHWDVDMMAGTLGDPRTEEGRAFLRSRSPINFAHQTRNPVLIAQGANDLRVPQDQSDTMVEKMIDAGVDVTYVVFPDEGHGFAQHSNTMAFYAIMEVFFSKCLGGRREKIGNKLEGSSIQVPVGAELIPGLATELRTLNSAQ